jgi:hypothetical protein
MEASQKKRVFISWSGTIGNKLALELRRILADHGQLEPWVSSADISAGSVWRNETQSALKASG